MADLALLMEKLSAVANELGREIRIFTTFSDASASSSLPSSMDDVPDDFYDLTPEDYYRIISSRIGEQSKVLKTRKIREAEAAARKPKVTKSVIRVRFPDNYTLEAKFQSSDIMQTLFDLVSKAIARPDLPFYLYTTPPKQRIKDTSIDFFKAGFIPGAIVYFAYDLPADSAPITGPYLREDILLLNGFNPNPTSLETADMDTDSTSEHAATAASQADASPSPSTKRASRPKWFKSQ